MRTPPIELETAVVAITGAGRGIGRATARLFAQRGARVCLGDVDVDAVRDAATEIGPGAYPFALDVTRRRSFDAWLAAIERRVGSVDVLVNNAGIMPSGRFLEESDRTTDAILDVNVRGVVHGMRAVLPGMIERGRGHVVNVASMFGKVGAPGVATYVASKHAVVGLGASVGREIAGTGVTLTTVLPSIVNTELSTGIALGAARLIRVEPEDVAAAIVSSVERRPREVAVPRWLALVPTVLPLVPDWLESLVRSVIGDDRALTAVDHEARAGYERRAAQGTTHRSAAVR